MARRHTILVVDDEPDVVKSVQDLLRLDYRVLGATRASEGIRMLEKEEIHVVMSDQRMPEMTGVQFLNHIRGEHPEAIRLLFTGYADIRAVIDAINQGNVYRYITKPWDPDELQTVIREAVERFDLIVDRKRLTHEVEERNVELEAKNTELRKANELKTAFIQVASHELRTPLTILLGLSALVVRAPNLPPQLQDLLKRVHVAGERMQHLVSQLLSMLQAGQFDKQMERKPTELTALVNQAVEDVKPFTELRKQQVAIDLPEDLGTLDIDALKIRDALNHLLLNAIKFTPDGGKIAVSGTRLADGGVELRVSDTGVGIESASLPQIFQPFFTSFDVSHHSSGTYEFGRRGLGLGLSVVRAFIEMHGGQVTVESEKGRGTTFTLTLPPNGALVQPPNGAPTLPPSGALTLPPNGALQN